MKQGKVICCPLDTDKISVPYQFASGSGRLFLIPEYLLKNLFDKLTLNEYRDYSTMLFVERHLRLIEYFINSEKTYYKNIKDICGGTNGMGYQIHLKILGELILGRDKYQQQLHPFNYQLNTDVSKWQWVFVENGREIERSVKSTLDAGHPMNNEKFMLTLKLATLNLVDVVEAEYWHCTHHKLDAVKMLKRLQKTVAFLSASRSVTKGKIVDRVYSSFTSMTSVSRAHITYDGKYFTELDVSNCQPLLLIALFEINKQPYDQDYLKDVMNGFFYQRMKDFAAANGLVHEEIYEVELKRKVRYALQEDIKMLSFRKIFFGRGRSGKSATLKAFSSLYPKTYDSLIKLRPVGEEPTIAKRLQDLEAEVMLSIVPNCQYFPVHDGVYCLDEAEIPRIKEQIQRNFSRLCGRDLGEVQFKVKRGRSGGSLTLPSIMPISFSFARRKKRIKKEV